MPKGNDMAIAPMGQQCPPRGCANGAPAPMGCVDGPPNASDIEETARQARYGEGDVDAVLQKVHEIIHRHHRNQTIEYRHNKRYLRKLYCRISEQ